MAKVKVFECSDGGRKAMIMCPGCHYHHVFKLDKPQENGAIWTWNGDFDKPTFSPSMLVNQDHSNSRCHSFVKNGQIQFLSDSFHTLANTTIGLPEIDF